MVYLSIKYLVAIFPAASYEDKGVYTFLPYQVLPVQVQNTGASGRDRRMNPTKTAYIVYYRTTSGNGYQWREQALTREPGQTAESYTAGLRQKYIAALVLAGTYVLLYVAVWCAIFRLRKKRVVT